MSMENRLKKLEDGVQLNEPKNQLPKPNKKTFQAYLELFNSRLQNEHAWHRLSDSKKYELAKMFTLRVYHNGCLPPNDKRRYEKLLPDEYLDWGTDLLQAVIDEIRIIQNNRLMHKRI